jgi:hypothetical protein
MDNMYYIGLDVHKKTISYCVKDAIGQSSAVVKSPIAKLAHKRLVAHATSR